MENKVKKLYRSRTDRVIAGVCGGLGDYFEIDPLIFRILFLIVAFGGGFGILLYILLALVILSTPTQDENKNSSEKEGNKKDFTEEVRKNAQELTREFRKKDHPRSTANIFGLAIVALGLFLLVNNLFPMRWVRWDLFWPLAFIFFGLAIILRRR